MSRNIHYRSKDLCRKCCAFYSYAGPKSPLIIIIILLLRTAYSGISAAPLYSPTWGFRIDLPEGYEFSGGDGKNSFSFSSAPGNIFDLIIYPGARYASVEALAADVQKKLYSSGETEFFEYRDKKAALLSLSFPAAPSGRGAGAPVKESNEGWGLCIELEEKDGAAPLALALAYGPAGSRELQIMNLSALDSLVPCERDRFYPGPVTEFSYPRGAVIPVTLYGIGIEGRSREHDAEAAQALVDREYVVLSLYADTPLWKEAWTRFYRAIYRDSFGRIGEIAFILERYWNAGAAESSADEARSRISTPEAAGDAGSLTPGQAQEAPALSSEDEAKQTFAGKVLEWVQAFSYERNHEGSDFVNLVSAALEGRGDCDSRAMLWAILMEQANIPAAIMVSSEYSHAMGLGDIGGAGARFELAGKKWLVAETTAKVGLGLINQKMSGIEGWLGIVFQ